MKSLGGLIGRFKIALRGCARRAGWHDGNVMSSENTEKARTKVFSVSTYANGGELIMAFARLVSTAWTYGKGRGVYLEVCISQWARS